MRSRRPRTGAAEPSSGAVRIVPTTSSTIFKSGRLYSRPPSTSVGCSGGVWHGESEGNAESFRDRPGADRPGRQEVELGLRAPRGLEEPAPRTHGALPREG